jgi:hypothetical protein
MAAAAAYQVLLLTSLELLPAVFFCVVWEEERWQSHKVSRPDKYDVGSTSGRHNKLCRESFARPLALSSLLYAEILIM